MPSNFLALDYGKVISEITNFVTEQVKLRKKHGIVMGLSGGIDSSVSAFLATRALGPERVSGISMPEMNISLKTDIENARYLAKELKIKYNNIEIGQGKKILLDKLPNEKMASGNFSARLRMALLYYNAAVNNCLVLGTADKSELMLGYFTKFGDEGADLFPIGDLYKSQVKILAKELSLPQQIIDQPSSPRFWRGHLAEEEIGLPYDEVDIILDYYGKKQLHKCKLSKRKIKLIVDKIEGSRHKKEEVPIFRLTKSLRL